VYVSADRAGHMREVWPAGCDNAGLQDPLREVVKKWQLKPATENGIPVQIEALASFGFETKLVSNSSAAQDSDQKQPKPEAAPEESHGPLKGPPVVQPRVTKMVKPDCSTGQSCHGVHGEVVVVVTVSVDGTAEEVTARSGEPQLFDVATKAAKQCLFQPGTLLGKPTAMNVNLIYKF
jgi:hypothetical protein